MWFEITHAKNLRTNDINIRKPHGRTVKLKPKFSLILGYLSRVLNIQALGCFLLCQIPEISIGIQMERPVSVSSETEYSGSPLEVVHLFLLRYWTGRRNLPCYVWQTGSLSKLGNLEKEWKVARSIPIGWPGLIGKCRSIFVEYSHLPLIGRFGVIKAPWLWALGFLVAHKFRRPAADRDFWLYRVVLCRDLHQTKTTTHFLNHSSVSGTVGPLDMWRMHLNKLRGSLILE